MSRSLSPNGVVRLRELAMRHRSLHDELQTLSERIKLMVKRSNEASDQYKDAHRQLIAQLEGMDCKSNGNYGWDERIAWMLGELVAQSPDTKRTADDALAEADRLLEATMNKLDPDNPRDGWFMVRITKIREALGDRPKAGESSLPEAKR